MQEADSEGGTVKSVPTQIQERTGRDLSLREINFLKIRLSAIGEFRKGGKNKFGSWWLESCKFEMCK